MATNFYDEEKKKQAEQTAAAQPAEPVKQETQQSSPTISDEAYQQAISALQKPVYKGSYATQIDDIYQQIMNRDKFSYDLNSDMLYQQMRDEYTNLGQMAMRDTMGQAAALTGGYGSSYGQAVGQQQYNAYLKSLNEQVPELYGAAYDRYAQEGNDLYQQYNLTADLAADEYNKYQDSLDRYWQERDYNHGNLTTLITNTGYKPTADELAAAGMTQEQADALRLKWAQGNPDMAYRGGLLTNEEYYYLTGIDKNAPVSSGGGGGYYGGGGGGNGNLPSSADGLKQLSDAVKTYGVDATRAAIMAGNVPAGMTVYQALNMIGDDR